MSREHGARQKVDQGSRCEAKSGKAGRGRDNFRPQSHSTHLARGGLGSYQASIAKRTNGSGYENGDAKRIPLAPALLIFLWKSKHIGQFRGCLQV